MKCNEKTDIWALGIILYKMMTKNVHPFLQTLKKNEDTLFPAIKQILKEEKLNFDPSIEDPIVRQIIKGCLKKFPERLNMKELFDFLKLGNLIGNNSGNLFEFHEKTQVFLHSLSSKKLTKLWEGGNDWKIINIQ